MVSSFVLDASVAAAWCFADETTPGSDALRESLVERRAVVARLWHTETTNLLLTAERRQRIKPERCEELLELLASLPIETQDESDRLRGPVLRLARTHRLSVYDAVYSTWQWAGDWRWQRSMSRCRRRLGPKACC
jgi:predicted nucleic acid-binding protein